MAGIRGAIAAGVMAALCQPAQADPVTVKAGEIQLPISGLIVDLPANPAVTYKVSGSWSLDDAAPSFDGRDVVDEFQATNGQLFAGNWVLVGYFTAGGCDGVLNAEKLDRPWSTQTTLWGQSWQVRGGVYTFSNEIGRRPAALLCRSNDAGQSLLMYRFLVDQAETLGQEDILRSVTQARVLESASKAWSTGRAPESLPLRKSETRNRSLTPANRTVTLATTGLSVTFPDDGYVWLPEPDEQVDFITRMTPSLPEVSLEVMVAPGDTCANLLPQITDERPDLKARNAPSGWTAGPTLIVDGELELTLCQTTPDGAKLVGLFLPPGQTDVTNLNPILIALGNARKS